MKLLSLLTLFTSITSGTILQNGQVRELNHPNTLIATVGSNSSEWRTYGPNATEISWKGRWDSKHRGWWA